MRYATIFKHFDFEASHQLPDEEIYGKCRKLHGHGYKLDVGVRGIVNDKGWVMDFSELKKVVNEEIIDLWDHEHLNDVVPFITTAENLATFILATLNIHFKPSLGGFTITEVILWETPRSYVRITNDDL